MSLIDSRAFRHDFFLYLLWGWSGLPRSRLRDFRGRDVGDRHLPNIFFIVFHGESYGAV